MSGRNVAIFTRSRSVLKVKKKGSVYKPQKEVMSISAFPSTDVNARILSAYRPARQSQFPVLPFRSGGWRWGVVEGKGWGRGVGGTPVARDVRDKLPLYLQGYLQRTGPFKKQSNRQDDGYLEDIRWLEIPETC